MTQASPEEITGLLRAWSDGDQAAHLAAAEVFGDGELVEIARVVVVDGAPQQVAHVAQALFVRRGVDGFGLLGGRVGEIGGEAALEHGLAGNVFQNLAMSTTRLAVRHGRRRYHQRACSR